MNLEEYNKVKKLNYDNYCNYLKNKYGNVPDNYFINEKCVSKNNTITRTNEGLFIHHIKEDSAIMLSDSEFAKKQPFSYQQKENLCYCDYLEHFLLHIKIMYKNGAIEDKQHLGIGGIQNYLINDIYKVYKNVEKGVKEQISWKQSCADKIINDRDVYRELIKDFANVVVFYENLNFDFRYMAYQSTYNKDLDEGLRTQQEGLNLLYGKYRTAFEEVMKSPEMQKFILAIRDKMLKQKERQEKNKKSDDELVR